MRSSPPRTVADPPRVAGVKRPASDSVPSLLPAFEPEPASSPALPRPTKRVAYSPSKATQPQTSRYGAERFKYPTPVPTSSTGLASSSPPPPPLQADAPARTRRPPLQRTASERAPLEDVPTIDLDASGEPALLGRSGRASTFQLSANKLISRVHVRARYIPADDASQKVAEVELVCTGWNGVMVHCQSKAYELGKNQTFTSKAQGSDIMLDVMDARVIIKWPAATAFAAHTPISSESESELDLNTPSKPGRATPAAGRAAIGQSPQLRARPQSPISPTSDTADPVAAASVGLFGSRSARPAGPICIYEDSDQENVPPPAGTQTQSTQHLSQPLRANLLADSFAQAEDTDEDPDEENDPIVHSFGPSGDNLLPRMASFGTHDSPQQPLRQTASQPFGRSPEKRARKDDAADPVANHVINQLAFARVASTPLSTIMRNLPATLRGEDGQEENAAARLTLGRLKAMIGGISCIGEVAREGRDAAGKPLESEFYYIPDKDYDENRRAAVVTSLQKPGLRNCRKSHKQYYWRKPK